MLNAISHKHTWALVALLGLFTLFGASGSQASAAEPKRLTHKEVKALISTAKTPEDHMRLAQYFSGEADRLEAESKEHQQLAEVYRHSPISTLMAVKNPMGPRTAAHCEYFAKSLAKAAESARQLAADHEQMATDAPASGK